MGNQATGADLVMGLKLRLVGLESHKVTPAQTLEKGADPRTAFEWIHALTKGVRGIIRAWTFN